MTGIETTGKIKGAGQGLRRMGMEKESPEYDAMTLALGKHSFDITDRKVEGKDFAAGWQAALAYARQEGEVAAWQHRLKGNSAGAEWTEWRDGRRPHIPIEYAEYVQAEERPLYALPSPVTESSGCVTDKAED